MKPLVNLILILLFSALLFNCSVGVADIPKGSEQQHRDSKRIDSILRLYAPGLYKIAIKDSILSLTLSMSEKDILHYRRRGAYVGLILYGMSKYMDSIHFATINVTNQGDFLKPVDTYTYSRNTIRQAKQWAEQDPLSLYFKTMAINMDAEKYEELSEIARLLSSQMEEEKKQKPFDPDLIYYLDKFVAEIYGESAGYRQRLVLEFFYDFLSDPAFKYAKQADIARFISCADSIHYLEKYPVQMDSIFAARKGKNFK